jgi:hypothetical protein
MANRGGVRRERTRRRKSQSAGKRRRRVGLAGSCERGTPITNILFFYLISFQHGVAGATELRDGGEFSLHFFAEMLNHYGGVGTDSGRTTYRGSEAGALGGSGK